ncbi:hypothetical protein ACCC88_09310 [Sphingomonas sp. Sphisp140]|uniref:hypothetical protein n=1 Tax=unclassified Sphingomonas TaxID=196159 RepID=UPI0039AED3F4
MIPAGYLLKRTVPPPGWLDGHVSSVEQICSVSDCVNDNIVDPQKAWLHNGFGLANSPEVLESLVTRYGVDARGASLFYYAAYGQELDSDGWNFDPAGWRPRSRAPSSEIADEVAPPAYDTLTLLGYDVVVFGDFLEHSPISCNSVAATLPVNQYCLLNTLEEAVAAIDAGAFGEGCEDGVYTVFEVNLVCQAPSPPPSAAAG